MWGRQASWCGNVSRCLCLLNECVLEILTQACICEASAPVPVALVCERTRQWQLLLSFLPFSLGKSQNIQVLTAASWHFQKYDFLWPKK